MAGISSNTPLLISFLLISVCILSTPVSAGSVWTKKQCGRQCPSDSLVLADNYRAIGNKVDPDFQKFQDSWANSGASVYASNILATRDTGWPRIYEGCTYPLVGRRRTPGYPIRVSSITSRNAKKRYIDFTAKWTRRTNGPKSSSSYPRPYGNLQHGAYLWFNDPFNAAQWNRYPNPKWPYALEVNVWNRVDGTGYRPGARRFADYYDNDGKYEVRGHNVCHKGDCFYAYYVTLVRPKRSRNMVNINMNTLVKHLRDNTWNGSTPPALKSHYVLIETSVAAEARAKSDAKFIATIATMGR